MTRWHRTLAAIALALLVPISAPASTISVSFTVWGDPNNPLTAGVSGTGFFTFDSRIIPVGGGNLSYPSNIPLLSLSFTWVGHTWTTADTRADQLFFGPDERLIGFTICGTPGGCSTSSPDHPDFAIQTTGSTPNFFYSTSPSEGVWYGSVSAWYSDPVSVMLGAWVSSGVHLALCSTGMVYAYDSPSCGGALPMITPRGNVFGGPPPSPVAGIVVAGNGPNDPIVATLENGDVWQLCDGASNGTLVGNIFNAPGVTAVELATVPELNRLSQGRPNPFNPSVKIPYTVATPGRVSLRIFDASGRLVRTLEDLTRPLGQYTAHWDGKADTGMSAASGTYFCEVEFGDGLRQHQKVTLLR